MLPRFIVGGLHDRREIIGYQGLFYGSPKHLPTSINGLSRIKPARDFDLCEQVLCAIDGTSNQMGEVGDESHELNEVGTRFQLAAIDVNRVIEALKGVEADADRENHVERER